MSIMKSVDELSVGRPRRFALNNTVISFPFPYTVQNNTAASRMIIFSMSIYGLLLAAHELSAGAQFYLQYYGVLLLLTSIDHGFGYLTFGPKDHPETKQTAFTKLEFESTVSYRLSVSSQPRPQLARSDTGRSCLNLDRDTFDQTNFGI